VNYFCYFWLRFTLKMKRIFTPLHSSIYIVVFAYFIFVSGNLRSQSCLTIESILVDACSPPTNPFWEGLNEMFRFRVGPQPINANQMNITWANNIQVIPFNGFIQNGQTAAVTSAINATIQSCGRILEPPGLILPANSKVLVITSPQIDVNSNPFASLADTLYVLYHNHAGVVFDPQIGTTVAYGHFINFSSNTLIPGIQTFRIRINNTGCDVSVSYNRQRLVTQAGTLGAQDGASISFDNLGNPTYFNRGCSVPAEPLSADWTSPGTICDNASPINLAALITGTPGGVFSGSGVTGNQFNPAGLSGSVQITYTVKPGSCQRTQTQTVNVVRVQSAEWTSPASVCAGTVINLNTLLTGGVAGGTWSGTGVSGNSLNTAGLAGQIAVTYRVGSGACQTTVTRNIQIISNPNPAWNPPASVCNSSAPVDLNSLVTGTPGGTWTGQGVSNGFFDPTGLNGAINIKYKVGNGSCADSSTRPINVVAGPGTPVVSGPLGYCSGETPEPLTAAGQPGAIIRWYGNAALNNLLATGATFTPPPSGGTFWITQDLSGCLSQSAIVTVTISPRPPAPLVPSEVTICKDAAPEPITAQGSGGTFIWYLDAGLSDVYFEGNPLIPRFNEQTEVWVQEDLDGCKGSASKVTIKILQGVTAEIIPLNGLLICENGNLGLKSSAETNFTWSTGETSTIIQVSEPGTIILSVTGNCNTAYDTVAVSKDSVNAFFTANPPQGEIPLDVTIDPADPGPSSVCSWTLNGEPIDDPVQQPLQLNESGTYVIKRICQSPLGCADEFTRILNVSGQEALIYIPDSFTPNEDGVNEVFSVKGTGIDKIRVMVFNRWGELLYTWNCLDDCGWDGYYMGSKVQNGVYAYRLEAIGQDGTKIFRSGKICVIH
jgi:gliding motility-associated-like protein